MIDDIYDSYDGEKITLATPLASSESIRISLESIRNKEAGLNEHRRNILQRIPDQETWSAFRINAIEIKDLAYLSAATGDEFALIRSKTKDIVYHGNPTGCRIEKEDELMLLLVNHKAELIAHTHPDFDRIIPSAEDRNFIKSYGQKSSKIISAYTGQIVEFTTNMFDL